jgi:uncharacterized protein
MQKKEPIIGREYEIGQLDNMLQSGRPEFLAVYGRRRVGKTFLIRQYLKRQIVFHFTGTQNGIREAQLQNFYDEYAARAGARREKAVPASWQQAFSYLAAWLKTLPPQKNKYVVFIDEMPWADTPKSGFVPALDFFWNHHLSGMGHIMLVACGSATSWIKKNLINARGGLYNRVTRRIKLRPFNLHETKLYTDYLGAKLTPYQLVEVYMAMGGIPFYLKEIGKSRSAVQLIDEICFSPQGLLHNEYAQLYHSLFKNADYHIKIIELLAASPQGLARDMIAQKTKLSEATLSRTLEELVECDFISMYDPLFNKKKDAIYKLTDLYSLFYLKFIKGNRKGGRGTWKRLSEQPAYTAWGGYAFENICMQHIEQIKKALGISGIYSRTYSWLFRGNQTYPGCQIDMLIDRTDQTINLCEAKFTKGSFVVNKSYAGKLRQKKAIFREVAKTKKGIFTTLLTTFPAVRNGHYLELIDNEVTMDALFAPAE